MSGDRGMLARGATPTAQVEQQWPRSAVAADGEPPRVMRERKPALAALALLLIIGGALGAAYLVISSGHRVAAIEVAQSLGVGERIPYSALREVKIAPGAGVDYVPWNEASQVTRFYAATVIPPGTLLSSAMVAGSNGYAAGKMVVGLALRDGQLPNGLQVGDRVNVYKTSVAAQLCPGTPGSMLAANALVLGISAPAAASSRPAMDVRVALPPPVAGAVTCNAANGDVAVAIIPQPGAGGAG
jgi:hypothetical protein